MRRRKASIKFAVPVPRKRRVVVEETREVTTEPKVELRKPATLAQALTERGEIVVKPETRARVVRRSVKRAA